MMPPIEFPVRQELRQRVQYDVRAVLDRTAQIGRRERVVDQKRHVRLGGDFGHGRDVQHVAARVRDRLSIDRFRVRLERLAEIFRVVRLDEGHVHAESPEADVELRVRPAVQRRGADHVIARLEQARNGQQLRRLAEATASAATPPSSDATRFSSTSVVGFMMRV